MELSATFGLQIFKPPNIDAESAELLTAGFDGVDVATLDVTALPPNIDGSPALAKLKPVELGFAVEMGIEFSDEGGIDATGGAETAGATVGAACTTAVALAAGAADAARLANEKLPTELAFVIGTELTIGLFSLSLLDLSAAAAAAVATPAPPKALPISNLNGLDVAGAVAVEVFNKMGACDAAVGVASNGVFVVDFGIKLVAFADASGTGGSFEFKLVGVTKRAGFDGATSAAVDDFNAFETSAGFICGLIAKPGILLIPSNENAPDEELDIFGASVRVIENPLAGDGSGLDLSDENPNDGDGLFASNSGLVSTVFAAAGP